MANSEGFVANERLRRARSLHGWSQAELAERVGTSFEMVSRWERGITIPSPYYRERLCATLDKTDEELGFVRASNNPLPIPSAPFVFLACSHTDAEKPFVAQLKTMLQQHGMALWSSRQVGRQETATLPDIILSAQAIVVLISPEAHSSRHVKAALELAQTYQRPVYGMWIEGESWQESLPSNRTELIATVIDVRQGDNPALLEEIAATLEQMRPHARNTDTLNPVGPELQVTAEPPLLVAPNIPIRGKSFLGIRSGILMGLAVLVITGGVLAGFSLHTYFSALNAHSTSLPIARGGTWIADTGDPSSLLPNLPNLSDFPNIDLALYLPLFYGDAQNIIQAGAATEVPSIQNGGVNANATIWTFHLRPHLVWSDGQPYDARDVDYTWRLWFDPTFGATNISGLNLISKTSISPDYLSITFYLKQPFAPFLSGWVDGSSAPLPAHHFSSLAPASILKSSDNLFPRVTSGPFMMSESVPGDHYTVIRNPRYYRASEGLPYLDKIVFITSITNKEINLKYLQMGYQDSTNFSLDIPGLHTPQIQTNYTYFVPPSNTFEALYFNFHNQVLATHLEIRQAMAMAIDQHELINKAFIGQAVPLCTDHPPALHPGYEPFSQCPLFNVAAANKLLDDNGWLRGADGVRAKAGQRLEFEYSTAVGIEPDPRNITQGIVQSEFQQIGIKLDIQNYPPETLFGPILASGKASPPSGAVAGRYDIAEYAEIWGYDPDDEFILGCDQYPPVGNNFNFYCNHALDILYKQEQATADAGVRQKIFEQIHRIELTDIPFITLFAPMATLLAKKRTHNFQPNSLNETTKVWEWWCDQGKC